MDWRDLARRQGGAISREQLRTSGLSEDDVRGLVGRRDLTRLLPGVYTPRPVPDSVAQQEWAAVLWSGGVLSHRSAARRWRLPLDPPAQPHVTVADRRFRGRVEGVRVHRVRLDPAHQSTASGLLITSRPRTVIDLLRSEEYGTARELRDRALSQRWVDELAIARSIGAQPGRTGNAQLRRLLAELEPGAQAESERVLHAILRHAELNGWRPQFRVRLGTRVVYVDVAFPEQLVAIEVDGRRHHGDDSSRFEEDRIRQNDLVARGWRVLRFTWRQLTEHPQLVLSRIVQLLAS
jgi:very-short-patch-repair endonuclease